MTQIKINRLIGNAFYSDVEAYLYQEQLEHLYHGIDTDQFKRLIAAGNSYSFVISDYSMISQRQLVNNIRGMFIIQPRVLLFMGDEIQSIYNEKGYVTISLIKKGEPRIQAEKKQLIFRSAEYVMSAREKFLEMIEKFEYEHFLAFPYVRDLYNYLQIVPNENYEKIPTISEESFEELKKVGLDNLNKNPHPLFKILPDVYQMNNLQELLTKKDFSPDKLKELYEQFYSKFEDGE